MRWCHACGRAEKFTRGWYEVWIGSEGEFVSQPVTDPDEYYKQFRGDIFACGEGSVLILFERYLQSRTFDPTPARAAEPEPELIPAQLAADLNHLTETNRRNDGNCRTIHTERHA